MVELNLWVRLYYSRHGVEESVVTYIRTQSDCKQIAEEHDAHFIRYEELRGEKDEPG